MNPPTPPVTCRAWLAAAGLAAVCLVSPPTAAEVSLEEGAKAHLQQLTRDTMPGLAALAARDGTIVFQGGFGFADLEKNVPITTDTQFRIGSVSKQFTAAAVLRLVDEGKLSLTDPLEKFFPDFPGARSITVDQLLTHTSGIHSFTSKPEFMTRVIAPVTPEAVIEFFRSDPPDFEPGARLLYNNSGYFLAGEIVAKVAGQPFEEFLRTAFFEPLGMAHTGIFNNTTPPERIARGYSVADGKAEPAIDWDMSWAGGAGAMYSTVGDLHRWNEALFAGRVLTPASLSTLKEAVQLPNGQRELYARGVALTPIHRLPAISHGGGLHGWSSELVRFPDQRTTVVVLSNALPPVPGFEPAAVARALAQKILATEIAALPTPTEDPTVDKKSYPDFVGMYDYQSAVMTVTTDDGHLFAQLTGQPKYEIFPSQPNAFFWKVTDAQVSFVRDAAGAVTAAEHTQNGTTFRASRLSPPAVTLTTEELDAIVGSYQYGPATMKITRDGDHLFAQLTGQQRLPLFATSATEFEWRVVDARVVFVKDPDGTVTKAVHTQDDITFDAPRIAAPKP